jgi:predicted SnoaL-like aldol condensation-catalyzing enzyme
MFVQAGLGVFPDVSVKLGEMIAERDMVMYFDTATGTQKGDYFGLRPSGSPVSWFETHAFRVAEGKIVEHWALESFGLISRADQANRAAAAAAKKSGVAALQAVGLGCCLRRARARG